MRRGPASATQREVLPRHSPDHRSNPGLRDVLLADLGPRLGVDREAVAKVWPALVKLGIVVFWLGTVNVVEVDVVVVADTSADQPLPAAQG